MDQKITLADIFREAGTGTRAYTLSDGPLTFAGVRKDPGGETLLFTSQRGLVETDSLGRRDRKPYVFPVQDTSGRETEWDVVRNLMSLQADIVTAEIASADDLDRFVFRNASYVRWWRKSCTESPNGVTGRLMKRFLDMYVRKVDAASEAYPREPRKGRPRKPLKEWRRNGFKGHQHK